eukprot:SAG11_NODE_2086_length_3847_cov_2.552561_2_plen_298_part_00
MALPIKLEEMIKLPMMGIKQEDISPINVRMESDKYICIREVSTGHLSIVDMEKPTMAPERKPMKAESVIMNPVAKVLALSAKTGDKTTLQIFNMELKSKMKACEFPSEVVHWEWIDTKTIGIVTSTTVFHWTIEGESNPTKVFARHDSLASVQIMSYKASPDMKWLVLNGIGMEGNQYVGKMQLYSIDKKVSQPINGFAAGFATIQTDAGALTLFCLANKTPGGGQVQVVKIAGTPEYVKQTVELAPFEEKDFPIAMQASTKYDLLYLLTKNGIVHVYDTMTATVIYQNRICAPENP